MTTKITGGFLKGRVLDVPTVARPALSSTREALFSSIQKYIPSSNVLDLFAGSGSLGIEAISRGATMATLVEKDPIAANIIKQNLRNLNIQESAHVIKMDVKRYMPNITGVFEVIFVDPPYDMIFKDFPSVQSIIISLLDKHLSDNGILLIETPPQTVRLSRIRYIRAKHNCKFHKNDVVIEANITHNFSYDKNKPQSKQG
jgi:16S rRNA (guanine966-N2)-methyltransferase